MATVFRAYDTRLHMERAIKILQPSLSIRKQIRDRFEAEASTMAKLHHKNIVTIYDIVTDKKMVFMVMEILEGGSLMDRVEGHGPLHPQLAIDATIDITRSIAHAHKNGVIHRDIKPHNVLITTSGELKMTDFGIARVEDGASSGMTQTGAVMGTIAYMAPEQRISAKNVSYASDIYALTATLFVLLTERNPVEIYDEEEQSKLFDGLDEDIITFLKKGCHTNRKKRFQTCDEMIEALLELKTKVAALPKDAKTIYIEGPIEKREATEQELSKIKTLLASYGGTPVTSGNIAQQQTQAPSNSTLILDDFSDTAHTPPPTPIPNQQSVATMSGSYPHNSIPPTTIVQQQKSSSLVILGGFALIALAIIFGLQQLQTRDVVPSNNAPKENLAAAKTQVEPPKEKKVEAPKTETKTETIEKTEVKSEESKSQKAEVPQTKPKKVKKKKPKATKTKTKTATKVETKAPVETKPKVDPNAPKGTLAINSLPWSKYTINGVSKRTPSQVKLPAGTYTISMTSKDGIEHKASLTVKANKRVIYCWDYDKGQKCIR